MEPATGGSTLSGGSRGHWDAAYRELSEEGVSWYQPRASMSLALVEQLHLPTDTPIVDAGGGASVFVDGLLHEGFSDLTVVDVSSAALSMARSRLGARSASVHWINEDLLSWRPSRTFGLWHDRAVFHFLTEESDRLRYMELVDRSVSSGGYLVMATFAPEAPAHCSGLPVVRYGPDDLAALLPERFVFVGGCRDDHLTPGGGVQPFTWIVAFAGRGALVL